MPNSTVTSASVSASAQPFSRRTRLPKASTAVESAIREAEKSISAGTFDPAYLGRRVSTEASVVGSMLLCEDAISTFITMTRSIALDELFLGARTRRIATAILALNEAGSPCDYITVNDWLGRHDPAGAPWLSCLYGLEKYVFSPARVGHHIQILIDLHHRDRMALIGDRIREAALMGDDMGRIVSSTTEEMRDLVPARGTTMAASSEDATQVLNRLLVPFDSPDSNAVCWHWRHVTEAAGPLQRNNVTVLLAPPGTGKTAAAQQQAEYCAETLGLNVLMVLMESTIDQIVTRHAMQRHGADGRNINTRRYTDDDLNAFSLARASWGALGQNLHLAFPGPINGDELDLLVRQWKSDTGRRLDLLVVDHLNKMSSCFPRIASTDHHAVSTNFEKISKLAVREECALLLLAQPIKDAYSGGRRMPTMADIKGSGTPVEGAKQIVALHYLDAARRTQAACMGQIVVAKSNDGRECSVRSIFLQPSTLHIEDTPENRARHAALLRRYRFTGTPVHDEDDD